MKSEGYMAVVMRTYDRFAEGFTANHEGADLGGDSFNGIKVTLGCDRETSLEDIDAEARELLRDFNLLIHGKGDSWGLSGKAR